MKNENLILKLLEVLVNEKSKDSSDSSDSSDCSDSSKFECGLIGHGVIIRCRDAGVHYGKLVSYSGRTVVLKKSRRMWEWCSATENTLSAVAKHGINPDRSKIQCFLDKIILLDACEIIPISGHAEQTLIDAETYNEQ